MAKNAQKDRCCISYCDKNDKWDEDYTKTIKDAEELYDMIGDEATFKVLYDIVSGTQLKQT